MTGLLIRMFAERGKDMSPQAVRGRYGTLGSAVGIIVNGLLAALKLLVGMLTGSLAVTADAVNNLSDAGGSVVSLISMRIAQKPVDREHPFGHGRMEYIGAMGVGVLILLMGVELARSGVESIISPAPLNFGWVPFGILVCSILMKLWLYFFYRKVAGVIDSVTLEAAAKDSLSDVMATSAVAISMLVGHFAGLQIDGWMGVIVALLVLKAGFEVCRDTLNSLLGGTPDPALGQEIVRRMMCYDMILGVHDLIIHDYGPGRCVASVHAEVPADGNVLDIHEVIDRAEREISAELNLPICIHMDPVESGNAETDAACAQMRAYLAQIAPGMMLHDFRRVPGANQINLIFDVVIPPDFRGQEQLRHQLADYALTLDERYRCVIQFDLDYVGAGSGDANS